MIKRAVKAVMAKEKPKVISKKPRFKVNCGIPNLIASKKNFFTCPSGNKPERYKEKALPKTPPIKMRIITKGTVFFPILPPSQNYFNLSFTFITSFIF